MSFKKASLAALLAASMVSTPVLAQTSASSLSVAAAQPARAGAEMDSASEMNGGWFIPLLAILAVIGGVLAITSGGDDGPTSP
jgi:hypothetical protein